MDCCGTWLRLLLIHWRRGVNVDFAKLVIEKASEAWEKAQE